MKLSISIVGATDVVWTQFGELDSYAMSATKWNYAKNVSTNTSAPITSLQHIPKLQLRKRFSPMWTKGV